MPAGRPPRGWMSSLRRASRRAGPWAGKAPPARQPARPRLALEALEDRSLMSANFLQTNLASDLPGLAQFQDPTLKNAWGISLSPNGGAFWVSSNGGGVSELYLGDLNGNPI